MDATDIIVRVARAIERQGLETVLIGNAAAAMQGAPVTTLDIDFLYRRTPANVKKLKQIASELGATIYRPYYPASKMMRLWTDDLTMQVDFLDEVTGIRSFEGLRNRASQMTLRDTPVRVAALADIIKMKKAANRPKDWGVMFVLEKTLEETKKANAQATSGSTPQGK
jgi:predicted nucleotidyltransferase